MMKESVIFSGLLAGMAAESLLQHMAGRRCVLCAAAHSCIISVYVHNLGAKYFTIIEAYSYTRFNKGT